jgi:hypothetical protein
LPDTPASGTYYVFKDKQLTFNVNDALTITAGGSDTILVANELVSSLIYSTPALSFTLQYFATDAAWRIINKTDNELNPMWLYGFQSGFTATDIRQQDYYIDTTTGAFTFNVYDTFNTPSDGQVFSLKDGGSPSGSWSVNTVTLTTNNNIEFPAGTISSGIALLNTNGLYVKFRFDALTSIWFLIGSNV